MHYYNRHTKDLEELEEGNVVRMRPFQLGKKTWDKALVKKRLDERSYEIEANDTTYRRNRVDIKKTTESIAPPECGDLSTTPPEAPTADEPIGDPAPSCSTPEPGPTPALAERPKRITREPARFKDFVKYK